MKVLIGDEWKEFEVEFGKKMPEEIGGVEIVSDALEEEISAHIGYETFALSVACCQFGQLLLAQYMHYGTEDFTSYTVRLSPHELDTYTNLFS